MSLVVDPSARIAIERNEPDAHTRLEAILNADTVHLDAVRDLILRPPAALLA